MQRAVCLLVILRGVGAACVAAVLSYGLPDAVHAQIPTIPLPSDVKVAPPPASVPANISRFAGAWARGAWDGVLPHVLVVETVDGTGRAKVVYAVGDSAEANVTRGYRRVTGRIVGDLLTLDLSEGTSVLYHVAGDSLRGTYVSNQRRYTVTLTRVALAEVMTVPATEAGHPPAQDRHPPRTESPIWIKRHGMWCRVRALRSPCAPAARQLSHSERSCPDVSGRVGSRVMTTLAVHRTHQ